ncbi:hypothetical protein FRZ67_21130 [Panacibacter ginsenosidivorans]|uniref:Lipoprotein n=1 Tax=Panacibacter ginsenosidivorans TaxID=1813871 RepID=A0A5B8VE33_9BACT|nr:hypothetical protein [Panacibacter ginsenosidivorans]QEC69680.1 hypothetical protein FRZ67_21130 [Panacibacter ginsenosidivorans]
MKHALQNISLPLTVFILLVSCNSNNTNAKNNIGINNTESLKPSAPYHLDIPTGWTTEQMLFPIDFAPQITYTGIEDLRFTHGWGDVASDEHWTYAFLWWLDGKPLIDANILQENLNAYYSGLVKRNIIQRTIPAFKVVPTIATITKAPTMQGDTATYSGTIKMLDYIAQVPIILNCLVHIKNCTTKNNTAVFFEISPKPHEHAIWQQLNKLNDDIKCSE